MSRNLIHIRFYFHYHCTTESNSFIIPLATSCVRYNVLDPSVSPFFFFLVSATSYKLMHRVLLNYADIHRSQCVCICTPPGNTEIFIFSGISALLHLDFGHILNIKMSSLSAQFLINRCIQFRQT